ncbi:nuclear transport factor 2 family protein [Dactylosporangium salmoneum]|uniref:Nuclear transport factor 2 family protein n=1 Tax=Dactylosporangium salmoneum TaxID=53361 RepID=A0ABN3H8A8_9ACTN
MTTEDSEKITADDRLAITDLLIRYARACDDKDWDLLGAVFTADCVARYRTVHLQSLPAVKHHLWSVLGGCGNTQHLIGNVAVSRNERGVAVRSNVRGWHVGAGAYEGSSYEGIGYYDDVVVRTGDGWRIAERTFVLVADNGDRSVLQPGPEPAPDYESRRA